jgi:large subunit ribosomal protein L29
MKMAELRDLSTDEILQKVDDLKESLFNLRFQHEIGQLENPKKNRGNEKGHCPLENRFE